ncbi:unnamed protein product [Owenia fusiformis]|uniref:Uncharacterized protein n=1 Tax=Owenia fusiformis TaxID=6347 RepID=A0A8J1XVP5_OWEFU|nr:unnamed protein product [Owenia fusiformis]
MDLLMRTMLGIMCFVPISHEQGVAPVRKRDIFDRNSVFLKKQILSQVADDLLSSNLFNILNGQLLLSERNVNVSVQCHNHTMLMLATAVTELKKNPENWAMQMIDATGKLPSGILEGNFHWWGSFSQCNNVTAKVMENGTVKMPFKGKHCMANFGSLLPKPNMTQLGQLPAGLDPSILDIGVCVPSTCSKEDVIGLVDAGLFLLPKNISVKKATCTNTHLDLDWRAILAISILSVFGFLLLVGTIYDVILSTTEEPPLEPVLDKKPSLRSPSGANGPSGAHSPGTKLDVDEYTPLLDSHDERAVNIQQPSVEYSLFTRIILCFSMYTNGQKILNTTQSDDSLQCVHGIRFLSMTWVILGHTYVFGLGATGNLIILQDYVKLFSFQPIINAFFSVDAFFFLSGLLVGYLVLKEMEKKGGWSKLNWPLYYVHRFWRLTPPYMLVLMISVCLTRYMSTGPQWPEQGFEIDYCKDSWWTNLLYINNFVNVEKMCLGWSWYLANDMQFHWISPIVLIPFSKSSLAGSLVAFVLLLAHLVTTGILSKQYGDTFQLIVNPEKAQDEIEALHGFEYVYIKPYTRIGPYLIGIVVGYILYKTNRKVKLHWTVAVFGWIVAAGLSLSTQYGLYGLFNEAPISPDVMALYDAVSRTVWSMGLGWVVFACVTGYGGFVNTLLSWSALVPLSRLTYCAYLIHPILLMVYYYSRETVFYISDLNIVVTFLGMLVATYGVSFFVSLALEAPFMRLEKIIFKR